MEINKEKMEELLQLIEELVVNKIRIEKIQDETNELEVKRVLGQEVQTVSKIQEVVKKIQTENMNIIYSNLEKWFGERFASIEISGAEAEFDNYNEGYIFNTLKIMLQDALESSQGKIVVASRNDASNLIVEILSKKTNNVGNIIEKMGNSHISLCLLDENKIDDWIKEVYADSVKVNASIELFADQDANQRILITVPLSSSIIKAQLVEVNHQTYAIPMDCIEKVMNSDSAEKRMSNGIQLINYMGSIIPVIPIDKNLGYSLENEFSNYVVLKFNGKMKALPVNALLEQMDVVVRAKPKVIQEIKEFKGMAVLGDGNVTMVFDIGYLLGTYRKEGV